MVGRRRRASASVGTNSVRPGCPRSSWASACVQPRVTGRVQREHLWRCTGRSEPNDQASGEAYLAESARTGDYVRSSRYGDGGFDNGGAVALSTEAVCSSPVASRTRSASAGGRLPRYAPDCPLRLRGLWQRGAEGRMSAGFAPDGAIVIAGQIAADVDVGPSMASSLGSPIPEHTSGRVPSKDRRSTSPSMHAGPVDRVTRLPSCLEHPAHEDEICNHQPPSRVRETWLVSNPCPASDRIPAPGERANIRLATR